MESVFLYLGKVIVCSGVTFLYYQLSLKDKTFHHYNRFYLLSAMLISLLLPLIKIENFTVEVSSNIYQLIDQVQNFNTSKNSDYDYIYFRIIFSALGLVSFYFLGRLIYGIFKIQKLKNQFQKESFDGINFYQTNLTEAPFSYFRNLFWKNSITLNSEVGKQILKHEMVHIEQKHSFDKIFIEIVTSIFWFNPFFHIIKKEISLIHEYLADKKAVKQSDTKAFAQMLLASHFSGKQLPATSPFLSSNLKKRLKMLQKPNTKFGYARRILALPVVFSVAFAYMVNAQNQEIKETNIEIDQAVSKIKKDTISPKIKIEEKEFSLQSFEKDQKRISELDKKIMEKSKALQTLSPESKEFHKHIDEIKSLSTEISKIVNTDNFQNAGADFKINSKPKTTLDWESSDIVDIQIADPANPPAHPLPPRAPDAPSASNINMYSYSGTDVKISSESSKKDAKLNKKLARIEEKRAKLEAERAKLAGERARLMGERSREIGAKAAIEGLKARQIGEIARMAGEKARLEGEKVRMYVYSNKNQTSTRTDFPKTMSFSADNIKKSNDNITINGVKSLNYNGDDITIYIDGKESSKADMQALDPKDIARMNVNKKTSNGEKTLGEIRIETKKK